MILDKRPMRRWRRTSCEPGSRAAAADRMPNVPMTNAPATTPVLNAALKKTIRIIHLSLAGLARNNHPRVFFKMFAVEESRWHDFKTD